MTGLEEQLLKENAELKQKNLSMQQAIDTLLAKIAEQDLLIKDLQEQVNKNSSNSSKPPSSDGLKKPAPKSLRKPSGKKRGSQKGHKGKNLALFSNPDETIQYLPVACADCPCRNTCIKKAQVCETRQVVDMVVKTKITAHEILEVDCPNQDKKIKAAFPEEIKAPIQYGNDLQSLVVALNTLGAVSVERVHQILGSIFHLPLATGTINNIINRCAGRLTGVTENIRQKIIDSNVVHFDATGTRTAGKTSWTHTASTAEYTNLTFHKKRGPEGMEASGILPEFQGTAVHDCWASYWRYLCPHALCCAHLLRELEGVAENHPEQEWAPKFSHLLLEMKKTKEKMIAAGKAALSYYYLHKFNKLYDEIIQLAYGENPLPEKPKHKRGRQKKGKVRSLIERLDNYKASVCLFIKDFSVPFDNNQAERDLRMIKVKVKVSGCFRSEAGAKVYLKIMAYIGTAKKLGFNPFEAIRQAVSGNPEFIFQ